MDRLTDWIEAEKARGLIDIKTFRNEDSVRILVKRVGVPVACEEVAAEMLRMIQAPNLLDPSIL